MDNCKQGAPTGGPVETRKKVAEGSILNSPSGARETSNGRWYNRWPEELRDRVLNGELPVGKDEASILAGVQLRIEESWPSNARSPSALPSDHLGKLIPISEDAKESVIAELPGTAEGSRMSSGDADDSHNDSSDSGGGGDGTGGSGGGTPTSTCRLSGRFARAVPKRRSLILRPFMGSEGNKSPTMAHNTKYKDCLPPAYHSTKNMIKTIK
ncbi:hypothetical protein HPB47_000518, partial [Ixodes persulcatus]